VTAHDDSGALPVSLDWVSLADPDATTCVYMGRGNLGSFTARAMAAGLCADTPACVVINATRTEERVIKGRLCQIAALVAAERTPGPALLLIGRTLDSALSRPMADPGAVQRVA
jgi:siroheme synthase